MLHPTIEEIVQDPAIYRHFRRRGVDIQAGRPRGIGRLLITGPYLGWLWFLGRGPWKVRPAWLRVSWLVLPLVAGIVLFKLHPIGWLSLYFWFPVLSGWVWEKRINNHVIRSAQRQQYEQIEQEIAEMRSPDSPEPTQFHDPNRLKS